MHIITSQTTSSYVQTSSHEICNEWPPMCSHDQSPSPLEWKKSSVNVVLTLVLWWGPLYGSRTQRDQRSMDPGRKDPSGRWFKVADFVNRMLLMFARVGFSNWSVFDLLDGSVCFLKVIEFCIYYIKWYMYIIFFYDNGWTCMNF